MDIDTLNLSEEDKIKWRKHFKRADFPGAYGISLGEWKCNHSCRMCPMHNSSPSPERFITETVFERACLEVGQREINLEISSYGETFQHPGADAFMFTARKLCPKAEIVVATNGSMLDRERCEKIVDSGIDHLSFSLDAGSPESFEWLTGSKRYNQICANLESLIEAREKRGAKHLKISTHIIGIKELAHEFDAFVARWSGKVDNAYVRRYGNWAGMVDGNGVSTAKPETIPEERYPCSWPWFATKIEPNGDVSKCFIHVTGEKNPLGNIMDQSFESIWRGQRLEEVRQCHYEQRLGGLEFCENCIVWSLFPRYWERDPATGVWK